MSGPEYSRDRIENKITRIKCTTVIWMTRNINSNVFAVAKLEYPSFSLATKIFKQINKG